LIERLLSNGKLLITEEVLALITLLTIDDTEGIAKTISGVKDDILSVLSSKYTRKGVTIKNAEDGVSIEIRISLYYGNNVVETCKKLQALVAQEIEAMTGVVVKDINIKVEQIIKAS
jgi:uncharacterized alkaline shock family protein YloU